MDCRYGAGGSSVRSPCGRGFFSVLPYSRKTAVCSAAVGISCGMGYPVCSYGSLGVSDTEQQQSPQKKRTASVRQPAARQFPLDSCVLRTEVIEKRGRDRNDTAHSCSGNGDLFLPHKQKSRLSEHTLSFMVGLRSLPDNRDTGSAGINENNDTEKLPLWELFRCLPFNGMI